MSLPSVAQFLKDNKLEACTKAVQTDDFTIRDYITLTDQELKELLDEWASVEKRVKLKFLARMRQLKATKPDGEEQSDAKTEQNDGTTVDVMRTNVHQHTCKTKQFHTISGMYKEINPIQEKRVIITLHGHGRISEGADLHVRIFLNEKEIGAITVIQSTMVVPFTTIATIKLETNKTTRITARMRNRTGNNTVYLYSTIYHNRNNQIRSKQNN
eukprot:139534_1